MFDGVRVVGGEQNQVCCFPHLDCDQWHHEPHFYPTFQHDTCKTRPYTVFSRSHSRFNGGGEKIGVKLSVEFWIIKPGVGRWIWRHWAQVQANFGAVVDALLLCVHTYQQCCTPGPQNRAVHSCTAVHKCASGTEAELRPREREDQWGCTCVRRCDNMSDKVNICSLRNS